MKTKRVGDFLSSGSALLGIAMVVVQSACAISVERWDRDEGVRAKHNEQSRAAVEAKLMSEHALTPLAPSEFELWIHVPDELRKRCNEAYGYARSTPDNANEFAAFTVTGPFASQASGVAPPSVAVTAGLGPSCRFFERRDLELAVTTADGNVRSLLAHPGELARDKSGNLVHLELTEHVIHLDHSTVRTTCDHMPSPPRGFFEDPSVDVAVMWKPPAPIQTITATYDAIHSVRTCTENTY